MHKAFDVTTASKNTHFDIEQDQEKTATCERESNVWKIRLGFKKIWLCDFIYPSSEKHFFFQTAIHHSFFCILSPYSHAELLTKQAMITFHLYHVWTCAQEVQISDECLSGGQSD